MNIVASLCVLFSKESGSCKIPVAAWLAGIFALTTLEFLIKEMKERMSASHFWDNNRSLRKFIGNGSIVGREVLEVCWVIYGLVLYNSTEAETC